MITTQTMMEAFGWTLIHSFWQISLIGLLLKSCLLLFRKRSAAISYNLATTALISIMVVFSLTFINYLPINNETETVDIPIENASFTNQSNLNFPEGESTIDTAEEKGLVANLLQIADKNIKLIVIFWLVGFLIFSVRFAGSYWYILRIRSKYTRMLSASYTNLAETIKSNLKIKRPVQLLESATTKIPIVVGYLKPAIILPLGLTTSIPFNQLEAILVHEMAHIKRSDFLINLIRSILESILFYHPVFWWISHILDTEREHCCDDITIAYCEKPDSLQQALINLYEYNQKPHHIAAALYSNKYQLLNRIKRMKTKNLPEGSLRKTNHGKRGNLISILILMAGVILIVSTSAFSPRPEDLPQAPVMIGNQSTDYIPGPVAMLDNPEISIPDKLSIPDSTKTKKRAVISLELDEDGNLVQVTKDGKPLEGEEREKYERLTAEMNDLKEEEKTLEANKEYLEEVKQQMKEKEKMIQEMHEKYSQNMKEYLELSEKLSGQDYAETWSLLDDKLLQFKDLDELALLNEDLPLLYDRFPHPGNLFEEEDFARLKEELFNDQIIGQQEDLLRSLQDMQTFQDDNLFDRLKDLKEPENLGLLEMETGLFEEGIRNELEKDGLIERSAENFTLEMSTKKLIINGEKQPKEVHTKYLKIYNKYSSEPLTERTQVIITD